MSCNCPVTEPGPTLASTCRGSSFMLFMGLLEVFVRSQCDLEDPCGRPQSRHLADKQYDFIVVGGGSAGSVVANRLSEVPHWRVLLVEAGGNEPTGTQVPSMFLNFINSSIDWGYQTEPEEKACLSTGRRCYWPRGKVLGGTSVLNGMMYMRGNKKDYDKWAKLGNYGWSYQDVLPHFMKSEDNLQMDAMDSAYHGVGGFLTITQFSYHPPLSHAILQAGKEMGYPIRDLNGASNKGFMIAQTTSRNGSRLSNAKAFLRPIKDRPNLHFLLNTSVSRILINETTKEAYGIEVIKPDGRREKIMAKQEVILSAGTINSPQLLMVSGVGAQEDLKPLGINVIKNLPGVGKNLQNHVAYSLKYYINDTATTPLNWATAMEYLLFRDGLMSGTGLSEVTGVINSKFADSKGDYPDLQMYFGGFLADCAKTGQVGERTGEDDNSQRTVSIRPTLLHPKSRGYIKLRDKSITSPPKIYAKYLTEPMDMATLVDGIKIAVKLGETNALKKYGFSLDKTPVKKCENFVFGCDEYWECAISHATDPENHQVGTCKMGPGGDSSAVVDPELRVHGIKNLRVIDGSVMPAITSGNTNAPITMIAEKGSEMIKNNWISKNWQRN